MFFSYDFFLVLLGLRMYVAHRLSKIFVFVSSILFRCLCFLAISLIKFFGVSVVYLDLF